MKLTIAIAALLLATTAGAEDLCLGMPAAQSNAILAADPTIVGTEPAFTTITTCGGGISDEGERVKPWSCFVQKWRSRHDGESYQVVVYFTRRGGRWVLHSANIWDESGQTKLVQMPLTLCPGFEDKPQSRRPKPSAARPVTLGI